MSIPLSSPVKPRVSAACPPHTHTHSPSSDFCHHELSSEAGCKWTTDGLRSSLGNSVSCARLDCVGCLPLLSCALSINGHLTVLVTVVESLETRQCVSASVVLLFKIAVTVYILGFFTCILGSVLKVNIKACWNFTA